MAPQTQATRVRDLFLNSVRTLAEALEAKDPYTAGHSRRVTEVSVEIALAMALPSTDVAQIRLAAMLHDVGKIGVRESVLNKEGALTAEEYDHVMQHCEIGRRILEPMFRGSPILDLVTHHHEKFDGTGRPAGLRGEKIPLGARIIGLADAFDAMGSVRPYRPMLSPAKIAEELRRNSGTQFDPAVVEAFFTTASGEKLLAYNEDEHEIAGDLYKEVNAVAAEASASPDSGNLSAASVTAPPESAAQTPPAAAAASTAPAPAAAAPPIEAPPQTPLVTRKQLHEAIQAHQYIKALPFVTAEILQLTSMPDSDIGTLTATILRDPALVAKLLRLANNSFYASRGRVQTIERAVVNVGVNAVRELAMAVAVVNLLQKSDALSGLDRFAIWRHSLACAALCRSFAAKGGAVPPETAFVAGLLHDLGIAALDDMFPGEYARCTAYAAAAGVGLCAAEALFLGANHCAVASEVATVWKIDEHFRLAMALHHETWARATEAPGPNGLLVGIVKLADILARAAGAGADLDTLLEDVPVALLRKTNLDAAKVAAALDSLPVELMELEAVFLLHASADQATPLRPQAESCLEGKRALFVDTIDRLIDPVGIFLKTLDMQARSAQSVSSGVADGPIDLVVIRGSEDAVLTANLRELSELSQTGTVGAVKVLILGAHSLDGRLSSIYPSNMTVVVNEPYSTTAIKRSLAMLFSN
jgi:HD-GYP domain-containing protein (c-di-GMP phosphodiesterase class II)